MYYITRYNIAFLWIALRVRGRRKKKNKKIKNVFLKFHRALVMRTRILVVSVLNACNLKHPFITSGEYARNKIIRLYYPRRYKVKIIICR